MLYLVIPLLSIIFIIGIFTLRSSSYGLDFEFQNFLGDDCIISMIRETAKKESNEKTTEKINIYQIAKYVRLTKKMQFEESIFELTLKSNLEIFFGEYKVLKKNFRLTRNEWQKSRIYKICKIITGGNQGFLSRENIQKAIEEFNSITPLNFNEIISLPFIFSFVLLEFFCMHICSVKKIIDIKKLARLDIAKKRINISYLKNKIYLYYFLKLADFELKSVIEKICETNDISIVDEIKNFEKMIAFNFAAINGVIATIIKKRSWFDIDFLLELSELNKLFQFSDISSIGSMEKIYYYKRLARAAKKSNIAELVFARHEIEFPRIEKFENFKNKNRILFEAGYDNNFETNERNIIDGVRVKTTKNIKYSTMINNKYETINGSDGSGYATFEKKKVYDNFKIFFGGEEKTVESTEFFKNKIVYKQSFNIIQTVILFPNFIDSVFGEIRHVKIDDGNFDKIISHTQINLNKKIHSLSRIIKINYNEYLIFLLFSKNENDLFSAEKIIYNKNLFQFSEQYSFVFSKKLELTDMISVGRIKTNEIKNKNNTQKKLKIISNQKIYESGILDIDFFDHQKNIIVGLNDLIKNILIEKNDNISLIDSSYLLYVNKNLFKDKICENFNSVEAVFALCEYVEHTNDENIFQINNIFQKAAIILLNETENNVNINVSDRIMLQSKRDSLKKINKLNNIFCLRVYKIFLFYTITKFLQLIKNNSVLRKLFFKLKEKLRSEIKNFSNLLIDEISLAVISEAIDDSMARLYLRKAGERIFDEKNIESSNILLYIIALLKKDYVEFAYSLLKIFLKGNQNFLAYRCVVENFLGIKFKGDIVYFFPKLPKEIGLVEIKLKTHIGDFFIEIDNGDFEKKKWTMFLGGVEYSCNSLFISKTIISKKILLKKI